MQAMTEWQTQTVMVPDGDVEREIGRLTMFGWHLDDVRTDGACYWCTFKRQRERRSRSFSRGR